MKKYLFILLIFFCLLGCVQKTSKEDPTPLVETVCLVQKIAYDDGSYEVYKFDANKRLIETTLTFLDENNKIAEWPVKHEYNAAGNLLKTSSTLDGSTDNYIYDANGLLTRVDFKDVKGEIIEQFTVTMDSQKRLTKVIAKTSELTGVYEYNGQDNALSKVEVSFQGKVFDLYVVTAYESDKTKKSYDLAITGHPFDPASFLDGMIYYPFNLKPIQGLATAGKASTSYDIKWENLTDKLRVYYDYKAIRKYNSNNFAISRTSSDAIEKKDFIKTFSYSNCN